MIFTKFIKNYIELSKNEWSLISSPDFSPFISYLGLHIAKPYVLSISKFKRISKSCQPQVGNEIP